ncbi:hypothetical protein KR222_010819, partial [Zaprionus bogoriensis]
LSSLQKGKPIEKSSSLSSFPLIVSNEGLIRIKGRFNNLNESSYDLDAKNPIILKKDHPITELLILHFHMQNCHIGLETVIANIRQRFWITRLRSAVKKIVRLCQYCKNQKAKPSYPIMGQLPQCRIEPTERAFLKVGVDYFGPILVTVNRSHVKRYGVIFTCMSS